MTLYARCSSAAIEPEDPMAHVRMAWSWQEKGEFEKAIEEFRCHPRLKAAFRPTATTFHRLTAAYAARGANGYWREMLAIASKGINRAPTTYGRYSGVLRAPRQADKALDWLEKGYAVHDRT